MLQIAREHDKARELEKVQRYRMPQDMRKGEKEDYYEVDDREKLPNSEQKKWESEQLASAMYKFGAKDASKRQQEEYDLLLEDQIEFIQAMTMDDTKKDHKKKEPELTDQEKKRMSIKETKESLPVYPFRDDLIAAIKEHQVLIIEGETGSGKTTQIPQYLYEAGFTEGGKKNWMHSTASSSRYVGFCSCCSRNEC